MKYILSRILLILLLCFCVEPPTRAAIPVAMPVANWSGSRLLSLNVDSLSPKDTLTTAEATMKARFDSLERSLAPRVDTVNMLQQNRKVIAAPLAAWSWSDLQSEILETPSILWRILGVHLCFLVESADVYGLFPSLS